MVYSHRSVGISSTGTRAFVFDYGGTLLHKEKVKCDVRKTHARMQVHISDRHMCDFISTNMHVRTYYTHVHEMAWR